MSTNQKTLPVLISMECYLIHGSQTERFLCRMSKASPMTSSAGPSIAGPSATSAEKSASSLGRMQGDTTPKLRSCLVCRSRKVRCDKQSPCSNCRRANIACVVPSKDRPPRWPRRLDRPATGEVMERLETLESLVRELRSQLERAKIDTGLSTGASSGISSVESVNHAQGNQHKTKSSVTNSENVQSRFGRLVRQGDSNSSYLGNGFWSRINDEVCLLPGLRRAWLMLVEDSGIEG